MNSFSFKESCSATLLLSIALNKRGSSRGVLIFFIFIFCDLKNSSTLAIVGNSFGLKDLTNGSTIGSVPVSFVTPVIRSLFVSASGAFFCIGLKPYSSRTSLMYRALAFLFGLYVLVAGSMASLTFVNRLSPIFDRNGKFLFSKKTFIMVFASSALAANCASLPAILAASKAFLVDSISGFTLLSSKILNSNSPGLFELGPLIVNCKSVRGTNLSTRCPFLYCTPTTPSFSITPYPPYAPLGLASKVFLTISNSCDCWSFVSKPAIVSLCAGGKSLKPSAISSSSA